ncbi:hypothetical protein PC110_g10839 [Phytophthora cactorum]|uniref:Uncharacterized protein n=2 Tax=Phytophthora cactorum TaxID=29920 RepID=A0A329S7Y6_9STRA|nr:hypothetical protein PC114_g19484 [Phytophthora cactorum]KAG3066975.1 hypothetical protein PC122_g17547 [Phytophthora cactorum]RAW32845.1 hypothetical protein PC110_g10839 [Phytophthora cactorum]
MRALQEEEARNAAEHRNIASQETALTQDSQSASDTDAIKTLLMSRKLTMWNQRRQLISMKRNTVPKMSTNLRAVVVTQLEMRANRHLEYLATVLLHASEVDKFNWLCSREFLSTMQFPCRHSMIWLRYGNLDENLVGVDVPIRINKADTAVKRLKQMSSLEKFKSAQAVFNRIYDELSDLPTSKFQAAIINLEKWCQNVRQGDVEMPSEVTMPASESPSGESDIEPPTQESKKDSTKDGKAEESKGPAVADVGEEDQTATKLRLVRSTRG